MSSELKRIIYAEDEADIREIVKISLVDIGGFELQVCSSGNELLEYYQVFSPDLILMDMMMPGLNGLETYRELKKRPDFNDTPVIFMTAKVQRHEIQDYKDSGALDVIEKPFNPIELPDRLKQIWQCR